MNPPRIWAAKTAASNGLAEAISRFKAIEQIIAVTHSEAFAAKGDHVIILEKEAGVSKISIER